MRSDDAAGSETRAHFETRYCTTLFPVPAFAEPGGRGLDGITPVIGLILVRR